jgi:hypothetical protein
MFGCLVKSILSEDIILEIFLLKCDDLIIKKLLVANINNHFKGDLHGQEVQKETFFICEKIDVWVIT